LEGRKTRSSPWWVQNESIYAAPGIFVNRTAGRLERDTKWRRRAEWRMWIGWKSWTRWRRWKWWSDFGVLARALRCKVFTKRRMWRKWKIWRAWRGWRGWHGWRDRG